jgi:excisionase family DNA binding protein
MTEHRKVLSIAEPAEQLGCSRQVIYDMVNDGRLPSIIVGKLPKIPISVIDHFIADQLATPRRGRPRR